MTCNVQNLFCVQMAGLCWMAVVLAFSLSVGNTGAIDLNEVQAIVNFILNKWVHFFASCWKYRRVQYCLKKELLMNKVDVSHHKVSINNNRWRLKSVLIVITWTQILKSMFPGRGSLCLWIISTFEWLHYGRGSSYN